ncbi:iron complex outermembrane recepter protein [Duganella sp. CF458]|uniref:TonB-dependent receptor n=1 Tax=Duganella sp. CF458 TaxID=1884368 RepID=UPI0008E00344|nr:TonB-dependent receptor [Duganella sp. CF458]SFG44914.1 iron complex outermembrane recepter protein [Duganella sp. CF458]
MTTLNPLTRAVALACLALSGGAALAQGAEEPMKEVVVTATRHSKSVDKIPGAVSVISQKELEAQYLLADDPSAALATYIPGYAPSRQKMSSTGESLRGRNALILLDGVPQTNPLRGGMREGYMADTAIIERVEVINGASAMQGMGATGGIVNYITKSPKAEGTSQAVNVRMSSQLRHDSLDWKTGYTLQHKSGDFDLLAFGSIQQRGLGYDGKGRPLGIEAVQGDTMDSEGSDLFFKVGKNFGDQRLQLTINRFRMEGDGDYKPVNANFASGTPTSATPGTPPGAPPRNKVETSSFEYRHNDLLGGSFNAQFFKQDFASLYGATNTSTFQDAAIAPKGTLYDQSEVVADKYGTKLTYVRPDTLVKGLEFTAGLDYLRDRTKQWLAGTGRTWVPTLDFTSLAPFTQLEYEIGPLTVRGGVRHEDAKLNVDTYTTLAAYGNRLVQGGERSFTKNVKNIGAVWRFNQNWSAFVSSAEGFGLPDVGLVLRAVNKPGQSVDQLFDMQPVITRNNEIGLNWRGAMGSLGASFYDSRSKLGTALRVNSAGIGQLDRVPTTVRGWEISGELRATKSLSAFGSFARTMGKTATAAGAPMDVELGARSQGPGKLVAGTNWQFMPKATMRLQATTLFDRDINVGRSVGTTNLEEHFNGYTLVDLAGGYDSPWGKLGVGIENLADRQYIGYYPQSVSYKDPVSHFAGRGRTLSVSLTRSF